MPPRPHSPGLKLAVDLGPLAVFFVVNFASHGAQITRVLIATAAFIVASAIAMIVSRVKIGSISPMLWISFAMVVVFGGLTLWFHDQRFIMMKPTIYYASFAAALAFGLATHRPILEQVLGIAYPGLREEGWRVLTRNWALFFAAMAVANELVWRAKGWDFWVGYKLWGAMPATLAFALANLPMLMKHGLGNDAAAEAAALPPES